MQEPLSHIIHAVELFSRPLRSCCPSETVRRNALSALFALSLAITVDASEFYVSPNGSSSGNGSQSSPWNLQTALNHPSAVKAGDTIWLRGGFYDGTFQSRLVGNSSSPIIVRQYPGERATLRFSGTDMARNVLLTTGSYTWFEDFEITTINNSRTSTQYGSWPSDFHYGAGIDASTVGSGNKFINLLIHDNGAGVSLWNGAVGTEVYGCLIYYNGWKAPDRTHGHGVYGQNTQPSTKKITDNIIAFNANHGMQVYGSQSAAIDNFDVEGNAFFENGALFSPLEGRNLLLGGGAQMQNAVMANNCLYRVSPQTGPGSDFYLGYSSGSLNAKVLTNYIANNIQFGGIQSGLRMEGNEIVNSRWTAVDPSSLPNNTFSQTKPTGVRVFVRPNKYVSKRANIIIYNWNHANSVTVDISSVGLQVGDEYELHNALNYFGDVLVGTYSGGPISIPMTGHTMATPTGGTAPSSTFPEFGAFVLVKKGATSTSNTPPTISVIPDQSVNLNTSTVPITFTVGDAETPAGNLSLSAVSANQALVPNANIVFGGSGSSRTVTLTPAANQTGSANLTITVSDGSASASRSFLLTVNAPGNTKPTISSIPNQSLNMNTASGPIGFTVSDAETAAGSLTLTAASSNPTLIPNAKVVLGGSGANRTVTLTPSLNQTGSATITVTVNDGSTSASESFVLIVNAAANTKPTISTIPNQSLDVNTSSGPVAFTVSDAETAAGNLTLTATSSNSALIPIANVVFGGSGANRTVTTTAATGQTGSAVVVVTVSDGQLTASQNYLVTVSQTTARPPTWITAPTISSVPDQFISAGQTAGPLQVTVGDAETPAGELTLRADSSNPYLVPNGNIALGGSGSDRTITVTTIANRTGSATITFEVSDGARSTRAWFSVIIDSSANAAPTIGAIPDQTTRQNNSVGPIFFSVSDAETAASALTLSASSSNTALIPQANIVLGGSGADRTVTITPDQNRTGSANVTITVSDGKSTASRTFSITVTAVNTQPTISAIPNQTLTVNGSTGALAFMVGDSETSADSLVVTASSSDTTVVPNNQITLGGSGSNRTIVVTPTANRTGTAVITVSVSDGVAAAQTSFQVSVSAAGPTSYVYLPLEAESGNVVAPMTVTAIPQAPDQQYISSPQDDQGSVSFRVTIPATDTYYVWCRVFAPSSTSDSFIVSVDGVNPDTYDVAENTWSQTWQWSVVNGRGGSVALTINPRPFVLTQGDHIITFATREANTIMDRLIITNDRGISFGESNIAP